MPGNQTDTSPSRPPLCIHAWVEATAAANPRAVAAVHGEDRLTYGELNALANQLAHCLRRLGVQPDTPVGLFMERSLRLVIACLGVLKAGGCCVLLEPDYPAERIASMLAGVPPAVILSQRHLLDRLPPANLPLVLDLERHDTTRESRRNPGLTTEPGNLAFVFHTSGSTGQPKGVMRSHRGYVASTLAALGRFPVTPDRVSLLKTGISHINFGGELFHPLLAGATLIIAGAAATADVEQLATLIRRHRVNYLSLTPSLLRQFLAIPDFARSESLRLVQCSGEVLPLAVQEKFLATLDAELRVAYGCSECPGVASWRCRPDEERAWHVVGRPRQGRRIYVVDQELNLAEAGEIGEILVNSPGLSRGYWQDPALTADRFLPDPFSGPGERLYRTGDLGRVRQGGVIEYIGRSDNQVQIRGMRVELAEVERALDNLPYVAAAVARAAHNPRGENVVVAYLVPADGARAGTAQMRQELGRTLPRHMVPSQFIWLQSLPLTPNGKVYYGALPPPDFNRDHLDERFVPPRTPAETAIAAIWADLLNLSVVGMNDDFFALGGHSLLITQVIARIEHSLRVRLSQSTFFASPTIAGLARAVEAELALSRHARG